MIHDAQQREEFMLEALEKIAALWSGDKAPEAEDYHDTESAFNNGVDCATYDAAMIARDALKVIRADEDEPSKGQIVESAYLSALAAADKGAP